MKTPSSPTPIEEYVRTLSSPVRAFLKAQLRTFQSETFLEIGTGLAETTLWLTQTFPAMRIDTVEKSARIAAQAYKNITAAGVEDGVHLYVEDALVFYPTQRYDAILIDASKAQQEALVKRFIPFLNPAGFILVDNIEVNRLKDHPDTRPRKTLIAKAEAFKTWVKSQEIMEATPYPIGDGIIVMTHKAGAFK